MKLSISMRNPNIGSKSVKGGGMLYWMKVEIGKDEYDALSELDLTGAYLEAHDVEVVVGEKAATEEKPKGGPLSQSAAMLCMTGKFFDFIADRYVTSIDICTVKSDETQNEYCRQAICDICGIASRAELDHNETAAARFRELMGEYRVWLETNV